MNNPLNRKIGLKQKMFTFVLFADYWKSSLQ